MIKWIGFHDTMGIRFALRPLLRRDRIWGFGAEILQLEVGPGEPLGLAKQSPDDKTKSERGLESEVRVFLRGFSASKRSCTRSLNRAG